MAHKNIKAAAIRYRHRKDLVPKVVAKGSGKIAEMIIQIAAENNIPIKDDPCLVEALSKLDLYDDIPPELYRAVAEILVFVYRMTAEQYT
jgi:flagellar biosynthesis protein